MKRLFYCIAPAESSLSICLHKNAHAAAEAKVSCSVERSFAADLVLWRGT